MPTGRLSHKETDLNKYISNNFPLLLRVWCHAQKLGNTCSWVGISTVHGNSSGSIQELVACIYHCNTTAVVTLTACAEWQVYKETSHKVTLDYFPNWKTRSLYSKFFSPWHVINHYHNFTVTTKYPNFTVRISSNDVVMVWLVFTVPFPTFQKHLSLSQENMHYAA